MANPAFSWLEDDFIYPPNTLLKTSKMAIPGAGLKAGESRMRRLVFVLAQGMTESCRVPGVSLVARTMPISPAFPDNDLYKVKHDLSPAFVDMVLLNLPYLQQVKDFSDFHIN
ncbi:hypothetical protein GW590_18385 [Rahnella sp. SAP-1]|uniref:Uncharacterized protein n=1 Tax=Rouxiella aceris TaxID=2703884 RepID=A0A848MP34_9GAMM|nr:hypothetical protein [Rouxiella aceris]NMP28829.1 hypothetical protein [Rouxiella aceris]